MKLIASDLKEQLEKLNSLLSNKGAIENSDKFVFDREGIFAFNGSIFVATCFQNDIEGAVEGGTFYKLINKHGTNQIEIKTNENKLSVIKGRSVADFSFDAETKCPVDLDIENWKKLPNQFLDAVNTCAFTTGDDYTDMRTVCIHVYDDVATSSDVARATVYKMKKPIKDELFIPKDVLEYLNKSKPVYYAIKNNWIYFMDLDDTIVCYREPTFSSDYPNVEKIVNQMEGFKEIELPEKLYDSLAKASVFLEQKFEKDRFVKVVCENGTLRINSKGITGSYKESMKVPFNDNISFLINPSFMSQIMEKSNTVNINEMAIKISNKEVVYMTCLAQEAE